MKRLLVLITSLILVGCTESEDDARDVYMKGIRYAEANLAICQKELDTLKNPYSQPEPSEPQYEEVEAYEYDGTTCYDGERTECGLKLDHCDNKYRYECLQNAKFKVVTKRKQVEE